MKKNYYCYRATITFSGAIGAKSEQEAIDKVVKDSERLPETVPKLFDESNDLWGHI